LDRRQRPALDPLRKRETAHLEPALRAGRRTAAEEHGVCPLSPPGRDATGVVAGVALLLVRGVVLLVDHDQAEVAKRSEDGRAGPDADPGLAATKPLPLVVALAQPELRVEHRDSLAEAL